MSEQTENQRAASAFKSQAQNLANISPEALVRRELGQANFLSLFDDFKAMQAFAQRAANCSWSGVPVRLLNEFSQRYNSLIQQIQPIQTFTVMRSGVDLPGEISRCVSNYQNQWNSFYTYIAPHLIYAESLDAGADKSRETLANIMNEANALQIRFKDEFGKQKTELEVERAKMMAAFGDKIKSLMAEMGEAQARIQDMQERQKKNLEQMAKQQEAVLNADRERITKRVAELESKTTAHLEQSMLRQENDLKIQQERLNAVVTQIEENAKGKAVGMQSKEFDGLADGYKSGCRMWAGFAVIAGLCLFLSIHDIPPPAGNSKYDILAHLFPRLVTVTLLSTALIFCIRNFSAQMHNLVVNRHRQKALRTFEVFAGATTDPATKNAVLVQATQAIFAPQPSGYLKTDQEMPQINQVTEIVRGVTGKENK